MATRKTYSYLVIGLFVVFFFSVVLSFAKLSLMTPDKPPISGHALVQSGNVSITVSGVLSITTADGDEINFTGCSPGNTIFSSADDGNNLSSCPGFVAQAIIVRNDGSAPANVSVNATNWGEAHGGTFINASSDDSWFAYRISNSTRNVSNDGGCIGNYQSSWTNITSTSLMLACDRLQNHLVRNSLEFDVAIFVPASTAPGENQVLLTFRADNVI